MVHVLFVADFQGLCPTGWNDGEGYIKMAGDTFIFKLFFTDTKP